MIDEENTRPSGATETEDGGASLRIGPIEKKQVYVVAPVPSAVLGAAMLAAISSSGGGPLGAPVPMLSEPRRDVSRSRPNRHHAPPREQGKREMARRVRQRKASSERP